MSTAPTITMYAGPWRDGRVAPVMPSEDAERVLTEDFEEWRRSLPAGSGRVVDFQIQTGCPDTSRPWEARMIWTCRVVS